MGAVKGPAGFSELGQRIAAQQDGAGWRDEQVAAARTRFLDEPQVTTRAAGHRALRPALAVAALLPLLWLGGQRLAASRAPLAFEVGGAQGQAGGAWLTAQGEPLPVRFADGATLLLSPQTRARVAEVHENGARVELWQGQLAVSVPHKSSTRWVFLAGPFDVQVTGTRFDLGWDEAQHTFRLDMSDGSVTVGGPGIAGRRTVVAGQRLSLPVGAPASPQPASAWPAASAQGAASIAPTAAPPTSAAPAPEAPAAGGAAPRVTTSGEPASSARPARMSWKEHALAGRFAEGLEAADKAGFDGLLASLDGDDLILLADTARLAGAGDRARRGYTTARQRFAGGGAAARAAFELGRMEASGPSGGVPWFRLYLAESPGGPLAREAMGRVLEALLRQHDKVSAAALARDYLRLYPGGPHAKLARSVVDE